MAHPARIDVPEILTAAVSLLEEHGPQGVTMRELARRLGVSAPSLYFHVESREDLLREMTAEGLRRFTRAMVEAGAGSGEARARVRALGHAYIEFAEQNRQLFTLVFGPCPDEPRVDESLSVEASAPVLDLARELAGDERALFLAESLWAFVHGYTVLRLAGQFLLNPDHEAGFFFGLDLILDGALAAPSGLR
jgi:AcrR family transcriptional regulator